jgi:hypothetical protein
MFLRFAISNNQLSPLTEECISIALFGPAVMASQSPMIFSCRQRLPSLDMNLTLTWSLTDDLGPKFIDLGCKRNGFMYKNKGMLKSLLCVLRDYTQSPVHPCPLLVTISDELISKRIKRLTIEFVDPQHRTY